MNPIISKHMATIEMYHIATNHHRFTLIVCGGRVIHCDEAVKAYYLNRSIVDVIDTLESEPTLGVTWVHEIVGDVPNEELL